MGPVSGNHGLVRSVLTGPIHVGAYRRVTFYGDLELGSARHRVCYSDGSAALRELSYAGSNKSLSAEELALMLTQRLGKNMGDALLCVVVCDIPQTVAPLKHAEQSRRDDDKKALAKLRLREGAPGPLPAMDRLLSGHPLDRARLALLESVTPLAEARCTRGWLMDVIYGMVMANFDAARDPDPDGIPGPALVIDGVDWRGADRSDARCAGLLCSDALLGLLLSRRGLPWAELQPHLGPEDLADSHGLVFDETRGTFRVVADGAAGVRFFAAPSYQGNLQGESDVRIPSVIAHIHMLRERSPTAVEEALRRVGADAAALEDWAVRLKRLDRHLLFVNDADYVCTSLAMLCNLDAWQEVRNRDNGSSDEPPSSHKRAFSSTSEPRAGRAGKAPEAPGAPKRARAGSPEPPALNAEELSTPEAEESDEADEADEAEEAEEAEEAANPRAPGEFGQPLASTAPRVFVCLTQRGKTNAAELFQDVHDRAKRRGVSARELEALLVTLEEVHAGLLGTPMVIDAAGHKCTARSAGLLCFDANLLLEQLLGGMLGPGRVTMSAALRARAVESLLGAWALAGNDFVPRGVPGAHADSLHYALVELTRETLATRDSAVSMRTLAPFVDPEERGPEWAQDFLGGVALKALQAADRISAVLGFRVMTAVSATKVKKMVRERAPFLAQSALTARYWFMSSALCEGRATLEEQARALRAEGQGPGH